MMTKLFAMLLGLSDGKNAKLKVQKYGLKIPLFDERY